MTRYLLDANHISPLVTIQHRLRQRIIQQMQDGDQFYIPVLAFAEAAYGFRLLPRAVQNQREWEQIQNGFHFIDVSLEDVEKAIALRILMRRKGRQLKLVDAVIASAALRYNLTLLTTDGDFKEILHLCLENWA